MHLEFLVEEPSVEAALENLLPVIVGKTATYQIHVHQGKQDLLQKLPARLRGYRHWLPPEWHIIVLLDEDRQDCLVLKQQMEQIARQSGFNTKTTPGDNGVFQVINRIAIEELEAWFFGDVPALHCAFPRIPETLGQQSRYRDPDAIGGGTWQALARLLANYNYYASSDNVPKIAVARQISAYMQPDSNRSHSFQIFHEALRLLVNRP